MAGLVRRRVAGVAAVVAASLALTACSHGAAVSNAKTACERVTSSLATLKASRAPGLSATEAANLEAKAKAELFSALHYAGEANSGDGSYNSLMTTIQEANRVPEALLVPSLSRQCSVILSKTPYLGM